MTISNQTDNSSGEAWTKSSWIWSIMLILAILIAFGLYWQNSELSFGQRAPAIWLSLTLLFWHLGGMFFFFRMGIPRNYPQYSVPFMAILIIIWFILARIDATFYFVMFGLFTQFFWMLPLKWSFVMSLTTSMLLVYEQTIGSGNQLTWEIAVIYLLFSFGSIGLGYWIHTIIEQSKERKSIINQLQLTQVELAKAEHKAGILAERQRLAHDIHDTLAQGFITIIMQLETAVPLLNDTNEEAIKPILRAKQVARDNLEQARRVVQDLRPQLLEEATLPEAIKQVVAKWERQSKVETAVIITGHIQPLSAKIETTLLRVVQEALTNISKHAKANKASITLSFTNDTIMLDIQDDGIGHRANNGQQENHSSGYGLIAMRQRVKQQNGTLSIESEKNEGTTLIAHIPILPKN